MSNKPTYETFLQDPSVAKFAVQQLQELQNQAEMESLWERADEEMELDLIFHRYDEEV